MSRFLWFSVYIKTAQVNNHFKDMNFNEKYTLDFVRQNFVSVGCIQFHAHISNV